MVYELTIEYNTTVLDGISKFFEDKNDVKLIIFPINVPKSSSAEFDYQYWTGLKVLASEEIDAYILDVLEPLEEFSGEVIAIIHRLNDVEDKLVVAPKEHKKCTKEEILQKVNFQEKFFKSEIIM